MMMMICGIAISSANCRPPHMEARAHTHPNVKSTSILWFTRIYVLLTSVYWNLIKSWGFWGDEKYFEYGIFRCRFPACRSVRHHLHFLAVLEMRRGERKCGCKTSTIYEHIIYFEFTYHDSCCFVFFYGSILLRIIFFIFIFIQTNYKYFIKCNYYCIYIAS